MDSVLKIIMSVFYFVRRHRPRLKVNLLALILVCVSATATADFEPFVIEEIRLEGLSGISESTLYDYLPVTVGDRISEEKLPQVIRGLYNTGFFHDVSLRQDGETLVVSVVERPTIDAIEIKGNKAIDEDLLLDSLKQNGFSTGRKFQVQQLESIKQELLQQYLSQGKYGVKIKTEVEELPRNRVSVLIKIAEGQVAKIRQIKIVGNENFTTEELLSEFQLGKKSWWAIFSSKDKYSKPKLAGDLEALRSFYLNRGYLEFQIKSSQISITPDKKDVFISVNIVEGNQYRVSRIDYQGDLLFPLSDYEEATMLKVGDVFSRQLITDAQSVMTEKLGNEGFAFANVNAIPQIDQANREVAITFFIDPGNRVYVRRVNFAGNSKTRDEVLRRELRQMEGGWISTKSVKRSRVRLQRLSFLKNVEVDTVPIPGTDDQVDLNIRVEEQPSGSLQVGAGFSDGSGFQVNASVSQENFLGTGNNVSFVFANTEITTNYSFGYTNPYYTINGVSRGYRLFFQETDLSAISLVNNFSTNRFGGQISFGYPISEYRTMRFAGTVESLELTVGSSPSLSVQEFLDSIDSDENSVEIDTWRLDTSWTHDSRNKAFFPETGVVSRFGTNITLPGSDVEFIQFEAKNQIFFPIYKDFILTLDSEIGLGDVYGGSNIFPPYENFYAGGSRSVRGYDDRALGPRVIDADTLLPSDRADGGRLKVLANAELIIPPTFLDTGDNMRLSLFVDSGNVFTTESDFDVSELRLSAGASITWLTPVGILVFSLAQPFSYDECSSGEVVCDRVEKFQFAIGSTF